MLALGALGATPPEIAEPCDGLRTPPRDRAMVPLGTATEPERALSWSWAFLQLVPSVGASYGTPGVGLRLAWQVTPLLYSWGTDPRLNRWRTLIAEPIVRQSGSVELYASPEFSSLARPVYEGFGYRGGLRAYLPLHHRGDYLSGSLGVGYLRVDDDASAEFEAGLYVLFGFLGWTVHYAPELEAARWSVLTRIRFF